MALLGEFTELGQFLTAGVVREGVSDKVGLRGGKLGQK